MCFVQDITSSSNISGRKMSHKESVSVNLEDVGPGPQPSKKVVRFFGLPVSEFPVPLQLTLLTSFVFIFYIMYGYVLVSMTNFVCI